MKRLLSVTLVLSLLLSTCAIAALATETKYKDTFTWATNTDQATMDPHNNVTNDEVLPLVYSFLIKRDLAGNLVGDLAESWEVSEDDLTWTFHIKKGVKFHNGKDLTSVDVKASYDRLLNKEDPVRYTTTMGFIDRCEIVDDHTIQLITLAPAGPMEASLTLRANYILDADYIVKYGKELGNSAESINGTGPYSLVEWKKDETMLLTRFDNYFGDAAKTKNIAIEVIPEASSRSVAIESHQVDGIKNPTPDEAVRLMGDDSVTVISHPGIGCHLFQFNCSNPIIANTKIRQAISYAVDRELIVSTLFGAIGEVPRDSCMPSAALGYESLGVIQQDQEKSRQLLSEAGYPNGFEMNLMTVPIYNRAVEMAEIVAQQLAEVGIKATIEVIDRSTFNAALNGLTAQEFPDWGMFVMGAGFITLDGDEGLRRRFQTSPDGRNNNNYGFYSNAEVDEALLAAASTTDTEKRIELYRRAARIIYLEDPVGIYMNTRNDLAVVGSNVVGFDFTATGIIDWPNILVIDE